MSLEIGSRFHPTIVFFFFFFLVLFVREKYTNYYEPKINSRTLNNESVTIKCLFSQNIK